MVDFYRRGTCHHRVSVRFSVCLSLCVCVCVCVSVTFWYCMKTANRRITQIIICVILRLALMPYDRPGTLVFKWDVL